MFLVSNLPSSFQARRHGFRIDPISCFALHPFHSFGRACVESRIPSVSACIQTASRNTRTASPLDLLHDRWAVLRQELLGELFVSLPQLRGEDLVASGEHARFNQR
jgi:hypothetical protein